MNTLQCYPEFQMITSSRFYFLSNVWINWMLMLSSDITARKLGSDFDLLIVQGRHLHNYVCWSSRTEWSPDLIKWINLHCRENGSANFAKSAINFPYKWTFPYNYMYTTQFLSVLHRIKWQSAAGEHPNFNINIHNFCSKSFAGIISCTQIYCDLYGQKFWVFRLKILLRDKAHLRIIHHVSLKI